MKFFFFIIINYPDNPDNPGNTDTKGRGRHDKYKQMQALQHQRNKKYHVNPVYQRKREMQQYQTNDSRNTMAFTKVCMHMSYVLLCYASYILPTLILSYDNTAQISPSLSLSLCVCVCVCMSLQLQQEVSSILQDRIIIGHNLGTSIRALGLSFPPQLLRDTASKILCPRGPVSLKKLLRSEFNLVLSDEHNCVQDALSALMLYKTHQVEWESRIAEHKTF